jgi:hypothetical protein
VGTRTAAVGVEQVERLANLLLLLLSELKLAGGLLGGGTTSSDTTTSLAPAVTAGLPSVARGRHTQQKRVGK